MEKSSAIQIIFKFYVPLLKDTYQLTGMANSAEKAN